MSVAMAAITAGCSLLPSREIAEIAPTLSESMDARGASYTLDPWPLDNNVAFLCLHEPGSEFTVAHPQPASDAQCVPLHVEAMGRLLTARFSFDTVPAQLADDFARSDGPWFFAVAGSRGATSTAMTMSLVNSPIPSDAGPS